jgi:hypothetical protein
VASNVPGKIPNISQIWRLTGGRSGHNCSLASTRTWQHPEIERLLSFGMHVDRMYGSMPTVKRLYSLLCCGLIFGYGLFLYNVLSSDSSWSEDFTAFYTGWTISRSVDKSDIYDLETQRRHQTEILARDGKDITELQDGLLPYLNPPQVSLLAWLSRLPRRTALLVWTVVQLALLAIFWSSIKDSFAFLVFLATPLVMMDVGVGALSIVVTVAIWQSYVAFKKEKDWQAALWMALATIKPQMCLLPVIGFAVVRWRFVWRFVLVMVAVAIATVAVIGLKPFLTYLPFLQSISQMPGRYSLLIATSATLRGLLFLITDYGHVGTVNVVSWLGLLGAIIVTIYLWKSFASWEVKMSVAVLLGLFFGLHVNPADDVMLIIPALLLYGHNKVLGWFLCAFPFLFLLEWKTKTLRPFSLTLYLLVTVLFVAAIFYRQSRSADSTVADL